MIWGMIYVSKNFQRLNLSYCYFQARFDPKSDLSTQKASVNETSSQFPFHERLKENCLDE